MIKNYPLLSRTLITSGPFWVGGGEERKLPFFYLSWKFGVSLDWSFKNRNNKVKTHYLSREHVFSSLTRYLMENDPKLNLEQSINFLGVPMFCSSLEQVVFSQPHHLNVKRLWEWLFHCCYHLFVELSALPVKFSWWALTLFSLAHLHFFFFFFLDGSKLVVEENLSVCVGDKHEVRTGCMVWGYRKWLFM